MMYNGMIMCISKNYTYEMVKSTDPQNLNPLKMQVHRTCVNAMIMVHFHLDQALLHGVFDDVANYMYNNSQDG